jgi:integrase/recombinase XerD
MDCPFGAYERELRLRDLADTTRDRYWQIVRFYRSWLAGNDVSPTSAKEYIAHLRESGYSQASLLLYYHGLKLFLDHLGQKFQLKLRKSYKLPRYHSRSDIERLIAQAESGLGGPSHTAAIKQRNVNLVTTLAFTGLRKSELLSLYVRDVDFERRTVTVRHGKGGREQVVPMAERVIVPLREQCAAKSAREKVFDGLTPRRVYDIVAKLGKAAGLDGFHPHLLRHAFATRLVEEGANIRDVQVLLGHQSIATTAIYLDISPRRLHGVVALLDRDSASAALAP